LPTITINFIIFFNLNFFQKPFSNTLEEILLALGLWTFVASGSLRQANLREGKING